MVAKTRSAQASCGGGGVEGAGGGVGKGPAAGPHPEQAATSSRRIAASRPRCILDITQNSLLSLFRVRHRASPRQASRRGLNKGQAPRRGLGERGGTAIG